jgi:hypothetical protein
VFAARWLHAGAQNLLDLLLFTALGGQYRDNAYRLTHAEGLLG